MKLAITFQQKYSAAGGEIHSVFPEITDRSFMVFEGENWTECRRAATEVLGSDFAFDYTYDEDFERQIKAYELYEFTPSTPDI